MDDLAKKLNIVDMSGWQKITSKTLHRHGLGGLLGSKYNGSVIKMLTSIYPEYQEECRDFVMNVVRDFKLSKVEDAINVPVEYLESFL